MAARHRNFLEENVRTRIALIYDLAVGEMSSIKLAKKYDASPTGINEFRGRHKEDIAYQRERLSDKFALLWIADKSQRLASYQQEAHVMENLAQRVVDGQVIVGTDSDLDNDDAEDGAVTDASGSLARLYRARDRALRSAAEELGQLPVRATIQLGDTTIRHIIEGVDLDKL